MIGVPDRFDEAVMGHTGFIGGAIHRALTADGYAA